MTRGEHITSEVVSAYRDGADTALRAAWAPVGGVPPAVSVVRNDVWLQVSVTARTVGLGIAEHVWRADVAADRTDPTKADFVSLADAIMEFSRPARILALREMAARDRGTSRIRPGDVLVETAMSRFASGRPSPYPDAIRSMLVHGEPRNPAYGVFYRQGGMSMRTVEAWSSPFRGLPVAVSHPITTATDIDASGTFVDRLRYTYEAEILKVDLIGVVLPETILSGAPGLKLGRLVDLPGAIFDPVVAADLGDRTILAAAITSDMPTGGDPVSSTTLDVETRLVRMGDLWPSRMERILRAVRSNRR